MNQRRIDPLPPFRGLVRTAQHKSFVLRILRTFALKTFGLTDDDRWIWECSPTRSKAPINQLRNQCGGNYGCPV